MLAAWAVDITDRLDLQELQELVVRRDLEMAFPDRATNKQFVSALRASVEENLGLLRRVLNGSLPLDDVSVERPLVLGVLQAQLHIPQAAMQRSYRVGFSVMWEAWVTALVDGAPPTPTSTDHALVEQVIELTRLIQDYQDRVAVQVAQRLSAEEHALAASRTHVRYRLIQSVLADTEVLLSPADLTTIGYPFGLHHVAVQLPRTAEAAADRIATGLAEATGARHTLTLPRELTSCTVWVGRASAWTTEQRAALWECLTRLDVAATIGEPGSGLDGFRESWTQAEEAEVIRAALAPELATPRLSYADVSLEVLLLRDRDRAARFVANELGELAKDNPNAARLRQTVAASYRLDSHVATAAYLHVHEHTVRNRLHKAEELLGHPLTVRSTEVQVALRLVRLL